MISLQYGHKDDCLDLSVLNTVYYTLYNHDNDECSEQSSLETVYRMLHTNMVELHYGWRDDSMVAKMAV